jgi:hypothetical protein
MARRFFYVSASLFLLALTYHLGARTATAQPPGTSIVGVAGNSGVLVVVMSNGETYATTDPFHSWNHSANVFGSGPTATTPTTMGRVKDIYRK